MATQERLKELFLYKDGEFIRKKNGKKVVCSKTKGHRYFRLYVDGKVKFLHRMIYVYHFGNEPKIIDHIDGDRFNNKIENLREATQEQNCLNRKHMSHSSSPYKNVIFNKIANKWNVVLTVNKKRKYFGSYDDIELADLVATEARDKYHGNFVNHGGLN